MKEKYLDFGFKQKALDLIAVMNGIVTDYVAQGYRLTVRQVYYQLVARAIVPNTVQSYDNVQSLLNKARLAGMIDWDAIEDRTRELSERPHWSSGSEILYGAARGYHEDLWTTQESRVFVIVEKEALAGVLEGTCKQWDMPLLAARGYPSATTLRELAKGHIMGASQRIVILHLGDHDPSGMDMSRDLQERLELFSRFQVPIDFRRIALNMDQIEEQQPPPNPAKVTDSRYAKYQAEFGDESWELDALTPQYLNQVITNQLDEIVDHEKWMYRVEEVELVRHRLQDLAENFDKESE